MKIQLSRMQAFSLAQIFAQTIYGRVTEMHLWRTGSVAKAENDAFKEVCMAVRSIKDPWDRRQFVSDIGYHFKTLRDAKGSEPRWQDYVAAVEEARKEAA